MERKIRDKWRKIGDRWREKSESKFGSTTAVLGPLAKETYLGGFGVGGMVGKGWAKHTPSHSTSSCTVT